MQQTLVNFLNHGLLPFAGRVDELDRIEQFWRGTSDAPGLRGMLITGESGIGKSRLLEESGRRLSATGGAVVHTKLYADAASSIVPLVARALGRSGAAQQLLKSEPEETMAGVTAAITRICGLRPTLLIVEDIHVLEGDAVAEFAALLERLSDEPLSLVCSARPTDIRARSVLELYLVDEMELRGLREPDMADICRALLGDDADMQMVEALERKTLGNAMALRSALRGAIRSASPVTGRGVLDRRSFADSLERNVRLLSEGMVAHLTEREKRAAASLASLGEVFARETAAVVLEEPEAILNRLIFKGVLHTSSSAPNPICGGTSEAAPIAFTHNLLYRYLLDGNAGEGAAPNALATIIASDLPVYSIVPFTVLTERSADLSVPTELADTLIRKCPYIASSIDLGIDWQLARTVWGTARKLYDAYLEKFDDDVRQELGARMVTGEIQMMRRSTDIEPQIKLAMRLLELTAGHPRMRELHLSALKSLYWHDARDPVAESHARLDDIRELLEQYPDLKFTRTYVLHLRELIIVWSDKWNSAETIGRAERELREILDSPSVDQTFKDFALDRVGPYLLHIFDSEEQLEARLTLLEELERKGRGENMYVIFCRLQLMQSIGRLDDLLTSCEAAAPKFKERGLWRYEITGSMWALYGRVLLGDAPDDLVAATRALIAPLVQSSEAPFAADIATKIAEAAIIRGDYESAVRVLEAVPLAPRRIHSLLLRMLELEGKWEAPIEPLPQDADPAVMALASLRDAEVVGDRDAIFSAALTLLARPILRLFDLVTVRTVLLLLERLKEDPANAGHIADRYEDHREAVLRALAWLAERRLPAVAGPLLTTCASWLTKADIAAWRPRITAMERERSVAGPAAKEEMIRVTMFGTITIQLPGQQPARLRGAQLCTLLGLMTADHLLARPLSHREFTSIAIGLERDPDKLRKSINFAVFRLRESLGSDAVDTSGETPLLRLDLVSVDLIDAHRHLRTAVDSTRDGALLRAVPELIQALAISRGEVPFPTLYDEFFESAREDFENELRKAVVRLSRALLREEDAESAEELLERGFEAMPDDEEIAELLREALRKLGKRTEATRVGLKVAEALDE